MENLANIFTDGQSLLYLYLISFLGGLIASVSPCSLSMLPVIIGYVGGFAEQKTAKIFLQMIMFVIGTAIVFSVIGAACAITGKVFASNGYFGIVVAGILLLMGLKLLNFIDFDLPVLIKEMPKNDGMNTYVYPILLGGAFAIVGTPCSTPILAGIMAFASISANIFNAVIMLFLFAIGQGLILIFAGVITSKLKHLNKFYVISDILMKLCGVLLILASLYIYYKIFAPLIVK